MSDVQIDVNKIIESLINQISAQAQRIAVLEATIAALRLSPAPQMAEGTPGNNS